MNQNLTELRDLLPDGGINQIAENLQLDPSWISRVFNDPNAVKDNSKFVKEAEKIIKSDLDERNKKWSRYQLQKTFP